ncbi:hypothetical protein NUU61_006545 [Penicillium alfredii]|uniref:Uncharacterized protein n=1 Tax=Penicillium alfredii TaxID=1506179 RepID=A0A9W9F1C0_9EURO|nr:uncharacterized protein NUU61_006545 [Penicillium alfredii]KAJ5091675.1 hypothetical protein NUU61_006545 [Penicillium alfredii]
MPAPFAKGIIVTVSVLVAAGIAVYESPQFKQWVDTSRRKIAMALHNLGDEIQPRNSASPVRDDISMTEEVGEAAEERRRLVRAEIMRRSALLESRRQAKNSEQPLESFDTLVDQEGNLRMPKEGEHHDQLGMDSAANSTAVDLGASQPLRRGAKQNEVDSIGLDPDRLHVQIPTDTASNHPSESVVQFTPTSEVPEDGTYGTLFDPFSDSPVAPGSPVSASASSHTEGHEQAYYAHPTSAANTSQQQDLLGDFDGMGPGSSFQHDISSTPSTAGSFSLVGGFSDGSSDGTLSDLGDRSVGCVATPASWSEVGSVISSDDAGHQ